MSAVKTPRDERRELRPDNDRGKNSPNIILHSCFKMKIKETIWSIVYSCRQGMMKRRGRDEMKEKRRGVEEIDGVVNLGG